MKQKLIQMILIDCISYTVLSLIMFLLSSMSLVMTASHFVYFSLFIVTTLISLLITLTSSIEIESFLIEQIVILMEILLVVYGVGGGIFHWFPFEMFYIIEAGIISLIVGFVTGLVVYINDKMIAAKINQKLEILQNEHHRN